VASRPVESLLARGVLLGLPIAALPETPPPPTLAPEPLAPLPFRGQLVAGPDAPPLRVEDALVVDLGSLWAGPLCGSLLALAGADVVKVESTSRPDGARHGPPRFFDLLNGGKRSVALDLRSSPGRRQLAALIDRADVVVEASRPRALAQLGIAAERAIGGGGPQVWASITGHGRIGAGAERVAFGDDASVAGGLVGWDADGPCFIADAVADPATGLVAAAAVLDALSIGGRWLLDVPMAAVAAHLAGPTLPADPGLPVAPPRVRPAPDRGPRLGEHTGEILAEVARH
jgi:crotonobetainyl-CoA:carnitine CoA-transferase CaiB-like acyl-CoA transferase